MATTKVCLSATSSVDTTSKPASTLTYSGTAVDTGSNKAPAANLALRDLVAVGRLEHQYVLNPYGDQVQGRATVYTSRFVGNSQGSNTVWLPQGLGVITEGRYKFTIYEGEFESGFRHGFGKAPIFTVGGSSAVFVGQYRGQWERGHRHGFGELVDTNAGTTYFGEWRYDRKHGRGEEIYADGSRYVGLWASGQRHGPGRLHLADGEVEARDYDNGAVIKIRNGGKPVGPAKSIEEWLVEAKDKLNSAMMEQEAAAPVTSASLSGVSGKAGLADRRSLTEFKEKELPVFSQQLTAAVGGPVELVVETDTFLAGAQSKVSVYLLVEGQSQFLLAPLIKAIASVCADASAKATFRQSISKIAVKNDSSVREVSHKLENKVWTVAGNFEDPSEVLLPNKVSAWLENQI